MCEGYRVGIALREEEWRAPLTASEICDAFTPILTFTENRARKEFNPLDHPEEYNATLRQLPESAVAIYEWWRTPRPVRRSTPKVSVNDPCPCGSGKKYKRCCSPLRAV